MIIKNLSLENFRNYKRLNLCFSNEVNIIQGNNAQGKTNLLEAIFFLSCAKSFHAKKERELIYFNQSNAHINASINTYQRDISVDIKIFSSKKRQIYINEIPQKRLIDYVGTIQSVLFSPDDLYMIKEGPSYRRKFLNIAISQLKPNYIQLLSEYNRLIEYKSRCIKTFEHNEKLYNLIDVYNTKIASVGAAIIHYRAKFIQDISCFAEKFHSEMSNFNEKLQVVYKTDHSISDIHAATTVNAAAIYQHLTTKKQAEIDSKSCLIGPHKDDIEIIINDKSAKFFASQGQIRTAVLALKMAEREVFHKLTGEYPILLLDDVLSELDENRQNFIINKICDGQVFITGCDNHIFPSITKAKTFSVVNGNVISEQWIS